MDNEDARRRALDFLERMATRPYDNDVEVLADMLLEAEKRGGARGERERKELGVALGQEQSRRVDMSRTLDVVKAERDEAVRLLRVAHGSSDLSAHDDHCSCGLCCGFRLATQPPEAGETCPCGRSWCKGCQPAPAAEVCGTCGHATLRGVGGKCIEYGCRCDCDALKPRTEGT